MSQHEQLNKISLLYSNYFDDCLSIKDFVSRVNQIADAELIRTNDEKSYKKIKGDVFEIFCHFFVLERGSSPRIPVNKDSYEYANSIGDYGVDAIGLHNNTRITIQAKFRTNPEELITYEEVAKCITQSYIKYDVSPINSNIVFITTAKDFNDNVKNAISLKYRPYLINRDDIDRETRDNIYFWKKWNEFLQAPTSGV